MMKIASRVFGVAGMLGLFACTQACNSQEDASVSVKSGVKTKGCTDEQLKAGGGICPVNDFGTGGKTGQRQTTGPTPPSGYTVRWSLCKYWHVNEDNNLRNNSRVYQVDETNDGNNYPLSPVYMKIPLVDPDDDQMPVVWAKVDSVINETTAAKGKPLVVSTYYPSIKNPRNQFIANRIGKRERALKIGQAVIFKGKVYTVASEDLGQAVAFNHPRYGAGLAYEDHCYRSKAQGTDTAGRVASGSELSALCILEDNLAEYNALSYYGWRQIYNVATAKVPMANNPEGHAHPDLCSSYEKDSVSAAFYYTETSAALNDMNGTERDASGGYYAGEDYCHMIVSGGYEVPGSKRPATRSTPYPGSITKTSYLLWRPVNTSLSIANDVAPAVEDVYEAEPVPASEY